MLLTNNGGARAAPHMHTYAKPIDFTEEWMIVEYQDRHSSKETGKFWESNGKMKYRVTKFSMPKN